MTKLTYEWSFLEKIFCWARYLYWSDIHFKKLCMWLEKEKLGKENPLGSHFFYLISQFYASLYVVVEGWKDLKLKDSLIDNLLDNELVKLLKRYRNSVYHYQPKMLEDRYMAFLKKSETTAEWTSHLHTEFCYFYMKLLYSFEGSPEQLMEFIKFAKENVGWLPKGEASGAIFNGMEKTNKVKRMLYQYRDTSSTAAKDLCKTIVDLNKIARQTRKRDLQWKLEFIQKNLTPQK